MGNIERGFHELQQPSEPHIEWVNLNNQGLTSEGMTFMEGIIVYGEKPVALQTRIFMLELAQHRLLESRRIIKASKIGSPINLKTAFPLGFTYSPLRSIDELGIEEEGMLFIFCKADSVTDDQYNGILPLYMKETNALLEKIDLTPFPQFSDPQKRLTVDIV